MINNNINHAKNKIQPDTHADLSPAVTANWNAADQLIKRSQSSEAADYKVRQEA